MAGSVKLKELRQEHVRAAQLLAAGLEEGVPALKMNDIEKAPSGVTDIRQVHDVCIR